MIWSSHALDLADLSNRVKIQVLRRLLYKKVHLCQKTKIVCASGFCQPCKIGCSMSCRPVSIMLKSMGTLSTTGPMCLRMSLSSLDLSAHITTGGSYAKLLITTSRCASLVWTALQWTRKVCVMESKQNAGMKLYVHPTLAHSYLSCTGASKSTTPIPKATCITQQRSSATFGMTST